MEDSSLHVDSGTRIPMKGCYIHFLFVLVASLRSNIMPHGRLKQHWYSNAYSKEILMLFMN